MKRAYSTIEFKALDTEQRIISGIASTPSTDRGGDRMDPMGARFKLPMPFRFEHKNTVGQVFEAKATPAGISIKAQIATSDEPGLLKDQLDYAWQSIKLGLVRALSIGWQEVEATANKATGGLDVSVWDLLETSAVSIPMNSDCSISSIKSIDDAGLAALGTKAPITTPAGASAPTRVAMTTRKDDRAMKKSYADQIAAWEATRQAKTARMDELLTKSGESGVTLDEAETQEHDGLSLEVKKIDEQLVRLHEAEEREKSAAKPIMGMTSDEGARSRVPQRITVTKTLPPGFAFARFAICQANALIQRTNTLELAKSAYPDDSQLHASLRVKAAIGAGAALTSHWADDLVPYNILMNDFIEFLRPGSILGKFGGPNPGGGPDYPSLRRVGFNVRVSGASAGLTGHWVGEGLPAPLSKMTTFNTALTWAKVEALAVLTQEEIRFSNPNAEMVVRNDIARAVNARIDVDFVDPALAAVANVSPASITNGVVATPPTGTTAAFARTDLATMIGGFATNNLDPADIVLIMSAQMALQFSMMVNTLGNADFPDINMRGGQMRGFPVIVSEHLTSVGSPSTQTIVAVKASDVYLADDGVVTVDASTEASLEMLDASLQQSGISGQGAASQGVVSLWQAGLLGLKAQREITWKLRRSTAVQYISPAAYKA